MEKMDLIDLKMKYPALRFWVILGPSDMIGEPDFDDYYIPLHPAGTVVKTLTTMYISILDLVTMEGNKFTIHNINPIIIQEGETFRLIVSHQFNRIRELLTGRFQYKSKRFFYPGNYIILANQNCHIRIMMLLLFKKYKVPRFLRLYILSI